jgi:RNA polymerase sigma factor (sigma-70 family)
MEYRLTEEQRQLAAQYVGMAKVFAGQQADRLPWLDRDDIYSAALLGLCNAVASRDPNRQGFTAFAITAMRSEIGHLIETVSAWKRGGNRDRRGDRGSNFDVPDFKTADPAELAERRELVARVFAVATERERIALAGKMEGRSLVEIAKTLGVTPVAVSLMFYYVRIKMLRQTRPAGLTETNRQLTFACHTCETRVTCSASGVCKSCQYSTKTEN